MLLTLSITAPAPGMIYCGGRFAGEAAADLPLLLPTAGTGALYLEYRPLQEGWLPEARRIVLSKGRPVALPEGVFAISWPDGLLELELAPQTCSPESSEILALDGLNVRFCRGSNPHLEIGSLRCPLPEGAEPPLLVRKDRCLALSGRAGGEQYLLTLSPDALRQTGFLTADLLEWENGEVLRAALLRHDVAGHAVLERWKAGESELRLLSSEPVWEDGMPRRPTSPEETALAAVESALLGDFEEAGRLLSPQLRALHPLENISDVCHGCLSMKYGTRDGRPCIGLLRRESDRFASVHPMYYQAEKSSDGWMLTGLEPL